jgi:hypothetical protein
MAKLIMAPWSFKEQRRLLKIAATSKSLAEIVERTGRTPQGIRKVALKLGNFAEVDRSRQG